MGGYEERHEVEEELLAAALVAEESIAVDDVEFALTGMRQSLPLQRNRLSRIQQQELVQPSLDLIIECVTDGISHAHFSKSLETVQLVSPRALLPDLFQQFQ